jgi:hypothetical protein
MLDDLGRRLPRPEAARWLELTLEAIGENYAEYRDYKATTVQSDRGELLYIFLDFLRLKAAYDRTAWNLWPMGLAHDVLIRSGRSEAAAMWRRAFARRTRPAANEYLDRYRQTCSRHGVRLRSIAERLGQRFVQGLAIDRLRALVRPALAELHAGQTPAAFEQLRRQLAEFTAEPSGTGLDVPAWLAALEDEVDRAIHGLPDDESDLPGPGPPQARLPAEEILRQIEAWQDRGIV